MKVTLDYDACHGHQSCAIAAPEVFGADDIGNAVILVEGEIPAELDGVVPLATAQSTHSPSRTEP